MKYSVIFASSAAAYAVAPSSYAAASPTPVYAASAPAYPASSAPAYAASSAPAYPASVKKDTCSGVVTPGYGQSPVTITQQGQAYPTCVSTAYGGSSCASWSQKPYVSTTIKDYNNNPVCVTDVNQVVTLYSTKSTITRTATAGYGGYATPAGGYPSGAKPTGAEYKIDNQGCWYELYEKIEYAPYGKLGSNALKGYPGSGMCTDCCEAQPISVKEYQNGKWNTYASTQSYGTPTAYATTYATPGVYTVPAQAMTVSSTLYYCAEVTKTATAGQTCTIGANYAWATGVGYMTVPVGSYSTSVSNGKTSTVKVVKTTTVYASSTGKVTVCPGTTTVYPAATTFAYPTAAFYKPGVYSFGAKTVTVTKTNQAYTCPYEQRLYPVTSAMGYPSKPTAASYPTAPVYPVGNKPSAVPPYPVKGNSTVVYNANSYPTGSYGQPSYPQAGKPQNAYPQKPAASTPCTLEKKPSPTPYKPTNGNTYPAQPAGNSYPAQASYPAQPAGNTYPVQPAGNSYPAQPATYPTPTPVQPANGYPAQPNNGAKSTPCPDEQKKGTYPTQVPSY